MMDDFSLGHDTIAPIMDELEVVNKLLGGYRVFLDALDKLGIRDGMIISDWGCGGGDSLRVIAAWARKRGLTINLVGIDATASAVEYAGRRAAAFPEISFIHSDVLGNRLYAGQFDVVVSSLFTHHFADKSWVTLIKKMHECCRHAVVINDLHRHWFAYHSIGILTRLFSRSEMVKHDSKVSVLRSFTRNELKLMLREAGVENYTIRWMWAFRWQVIIPKKNG